MNLHRPLSVAALATVLAAALAGCAPAVLAGSSVAVQQSVEDDAADLATKTDLSNAVTAFTAYLVATGADMPAELPADELANYGWVRTDDAGSVAYTPGEGSNAGSFCLVETGAAGRTFVVTSNTPVVEGSDCPEVY